MTATVTRKLRWLPVLFGCVLLGCSSVPPSATEVAIDQALASGKPVLLDLGTKSCDPCIKMAPILEGVSAEVKGRATVLFVDILKEKRIGDRFHVQMMPTQIFFDSKGKEVKRHYGFMDREEILQGLKSAGVTDLVRSSTR